ncbi:filamin-A-like [Oopsacas minuta]|uniref:Filamin-A-like n=1 Tax=Oopsacas minuta TaxID=111878 RepID=A0AAV7KI63_9METZ|nr:filamin-A-like [Oopsacas minuta]
MAFVNGDAVVSDEWKKVQEKTFTRWCNEQLKLNDRNIENLGQGFADGINLIQLIEIISQKKIKRYNKNAKLRAQKLENVQQTLDLIMREKVKLVNIRSSDIVDGNIKLILGLVWTLILHYQISLGFKDNSGLTPKQALLKWLQEKLKHRPVGPPKNLTSDWKDGLRLAALCDEIAPGLTPDADSLNPSDAVTNVTEAIEQAYEYLDVPKLMNPEDIASPNIDEKSMMTYLSEFIEAKLNKPLPVLDGVNVNGPGVESQDLKSGQPTNFTIDARAASTTRNPRVKVINTEDKSLPVMIEKTADGTYTCQYTPNETGEHQVHVTLGYPVAGSPFCTFVDTGSDAGLSKIRVYGEGVESNQLESHKPTSFTIDTQELEGDVSITIQGPDGVLTEEDIEVRRNDQEQTEVDYTPSYPGNYNIEVLFDNQQVPNSPFTVQVNPIKEADASKVRVTGEGIAKGKVGDPLEFSIDTRAAGIGSLDMSLEGPSKCEAKYNDNGNGTCKVVYTPLLPGEYKIALKFNDTQVTNSPFNVKVFDPSKVIASGPGIDGVGIRVNQPADVFLDTTNAGEGEFQCCVKGPDEESEFKVNPNGHDNTLQGSYVPNKPSEYNVSVKMEGYEIPHSPFKVVISDSLKLSGPAIQYAYVDQPTHVDVDTSNSGNRTLSAELVDPKGKKIPTKISATSETSQEVEFTPRVGGHHNLNFMYGGSPLPYDIRVLDLNKVKAYGPGLANKGNVVNEDTVFTVETGGLMSEDLTIVIKNKSSDEEVAPEIKKTGEDKFEIAYKPTKADLHNVGIRLVGVEVCESPYEVAICDPLAIKAYGPGLEKGIEKTPTEFFVELCEGGEGSLAVAIEGPEETDLTIERETDSLYKFSYTPERAGVYDVNITFCDKPIKQSPFVVRVSRGPPDASKCIPQDINETGFFMIDAKNAGGSGLLEVGVSGNNYPCDFVSVKHNGDYTFNINYAQPEPGETTISVKWHGEHIKGSPFNIITEAN